jgi:thiol-disulfide isomerase/thioredoxin
MSAGQTEHKLRLSAQRLAISCVLAALLAGCRHVPEGGSDGASRLRGALSLPAARGEFDPRTLQDRVVFVSFLATWCFPCLGQLPLLKKAQTDYGPKGLQVIAVGLDQEGERVLAPFADYYELNFPLLVASEELLEGKSAFGPVRAVPSNVLFARDGSTVAAFTGLVEATDFRHLIESAL